MRVIRSGRSGERRRLLRRSLWAAPLAFALLTLPAVGGPGTELRHVVPSAHAQDNPRPAASGTATGAQDDDDRAATAPSPGEQAADPSSASDEHLSVPPHRAPAPGSPAYRHLQQVWDAADLSERRPAGTQWRTARVGAEVRHYLLSVPPSLGRPAPLVVVFHGLTQRAGTFALGTGLVPATRAHGQVLAVLESSGPAFNDSRLGALGPDDDGFAMTVVHDLVSDGLVDPRRVVVAGFSNGAGMAMEVACEHPHAVAAVVSIDGALIDGPHAPRPTGPVRAYLVHGTADHVQPWNGRPSHGPTWPAYVSQPETVAQWVTADRARTATVHELRGGSGRPTVTVRQWSAGPSGAAVTFYAVNGMGHRWPSGALDTVDATALVVHAAGTAELPAPARVPGT